MTNIIKKIKLNSILFYGLFSVVLISAVVLVLSKNPILSLIPFFILALVLFFNERLNVSIYTMAFLFAFSGIEITFGSINAPIVDFFALFVLILYFLKIGLDLLSRKISFKDLKLPLMKLFGLFFIISLLSVMNSNYVLTSLKYLLRMITFSYIAFVILPVNILKNKEELTKVIKTIFSVSLLGALLYFMTVIIYSFGDRVIGVSSMVKIFDNYIFGYNHNLLAEVYLIGLFASIYLFFNNKKDFIRVFYLISGLLIGFANIIIMSRASFLAMVFGLFVMSFLWPFIKENKADWKNWIFNIFARSLITIIIAIIAFLFYMLFLNKIQRYDMSGSNNTRVDMSKIAITAFRSSPIIGSGPGTFMDLTKTDSWFMSSYGNMPLDSHGIVQKILVEQGIIGLIVFMCMFFAICYEYYKFIKISDSLDDRILVSILFSMASASFFIQLFNTTYYSSKLWFPVGICIAGINIYRKNYDFKW